MNRQMRLLFFLHILNDGYRNTVITLLPFIARDLSLNLVSVGILGSAQSTIGTLLAIPAGFVSHRIGGFRLLTFSLLVYSLGFIGIISSFHFWILLIAFHVTAIGFAPFHPVSFALVSRLSLPTTRGKTMGNFISLGDIGRMIIPTFALLLIPLVGWRPIGFVLSILGVATFFISQSVVKKIPVSSDQKAIQVYSSRKWLFDIGDLVKEKRFRIVLSSAIIDAFAGSGIYLFLTFFLLSRGIGATQLVLFTSAYFLGSLSGKYLLGRAVDIFGNRNVFILSEISMAIVLLLFVLTHQFFAVLLISFFLGLFTKGTSPVVQTLVSETMGERHYEKGFGVSEMLIQMTSALGVMISGVIADRFGIPTVFFLSASCAILATAPIIFLKKSR